MTPRPLEKRSSGQIASAIEYTDLRKAITYRDVEMMCIEAVHYELGGIVVPSALVQHAVSCCAGKRLSIATIISYPFGTQSPNVKAREAAVAVEQGVSELDVVPHFGAILAERWGDVRKELVSIRSASDNVTLKLVLETGRLSSDQIREACSIASDSGFEYVVNTVGFRLVSTDPDAEGSASVQIVHSLHEVAGDSLCIKAAGGVTTLQEVRDLLDAGAQRVAVSMSPGVLRAMDWASEEGAVS